MTEAMPGRAFSAGLMTGIKHERAARLAAEARVKVLTEALQELIGHLELASVMPSAIGKAYVPPLDADFLNNARAALKEPANG